jgi:hypothetical protein
LRIFGGTSRKTTKSVSWVKGYLGPEISRSTDLEAVVILL